jgi:DnaJ family protein C protein 3
MPGTFVDPHKLRDALEARAEAHMNDKNYDDAVTDLRDALEKASGDKQQGLQTKLNEAENQKRKWRCVDPSDRKTWQDNRCGHPNPQNGRDHNAVLELPANLGELPKDKQCDWIKKQYKKLARKWHPDKYKGKKERFDPPVVPCLRGPASYTYGVATATGQDVK